MGLRSWNSQDRTGIHAADEDDLLLDVVHAHDATPGKWLIPVHAFHTDCEFCPAMGVGCDKGEAEDEGPSVESEELFHHTKVNAFLILDGHIMGAPGLHAGVLFGVKFRPKESPLEEHGPGIDLDSKTTVVVELHVLLHSLCLVGRESVRLALAQHLWLLLPCVVQVGVESAGLWLTV